MNFQRNRPGGVLLNEVETHFRRVHPQIGTGLSQRYRTTNYFHSICQI